MNKLVSGLVKGAVIATIGFVAGIVIAEKNDRKENQQAVAEAK